MIEQDKLEQMEDRARKAGMGYDTGGMAQHYSRDVAKLIAEVRRLTRQVQTECIAKVELANRLGVAEKALAERQQLSGVFTTEEVEA